MASPTLQDQMGAMALIDELRHRRMNVQQHMNLPLHKTEVATRIRDYYLNQNIIVGDDVIEAGVRAYFDRRLRFDAPKMAGWRFRVADMWIHRRNFSGKIVMPMIYTACVLLAVGTAVNSATGYLDRQQVAQAQSLSVDQQGLAGRIEAQGKATTTVMQQYPNLPSVGRIGQEALSLVAQAGQSSQQVAVVLANKHARINGDEESLGRERLSTATRLLDNAAFLTQQMEALANAYQGIVRIENDPVYRRRRADRPELAAASAAVKAALEEADSPSAGAAIALAGEMMRNARTRDPAATPLQQASDIYAEFQTMGLPRPLLAELTGRVAAIANAGSDEEARKLVKDLDATLTFARTPLRAKVLHRRNELTGGIENATGGSENFFGRVLAFKAGVDIFGKSISNATRSDEKSDEVYVLYAEMVDSSGKSYPIPLKSGANKSVSWASTFGVEVSGQLYNKVRRDKESDGKIDAPFIGDKPANSLDIKFIEGVPSNPYLFDHGA